MPWLIQVYTPGIDYAEENISTISEKCLGSTYVSTIQEAYDYISKILLEAGYNPEKYLRFYKLKLYFRDAYHKKDLDFILFEHYSSRELYEILKKQKK